MDNMGSIYRIMALLKFQEYIESTDLAKKVSRWHLEIGPRLERVERRSAFDVHEYGTSILSKFPESDSQVTKPEGAL